MLARLRARKEWQVFAVLPRADRSLTVVWWLVLSLRGLLPAAFAVAIGVVVSALDDGQSLTLPLVAVGVVFVLLQALTPLHLAIGMNLGDRTAAWLYVEITTDGVVQPGLGHPRDRPDEPRVGTERCRTVKNR